MTTTDVPTRISLPTFTQPVHPLGSRSRVLLASVFGPYAQDDEYGSRAINPMELYHNQVTRTQGVFSLRMSHRSWGLMLIQANLHAPCTLLDFPTLDRFVEEITTNHYDIVGIGAIAPNVGKVAKMCELVRAHLPEATIVIGGHVASIPDLDDRIDADHIVRGEGVRWMQRFLGEDDAQPIKHPRIYSGFDARTMGVPLWTDPTEVAATLIPSVGCPVGCNFCSTSAMFGGKGSFINFYETGDELFAVMNELAEEMKIREFFVMDENFLLHRKRALRLLELMQAHNKPWSLYVFSSARVLKSYTMDQIVGLGVSWVWMGIEGEDSSYKKLDGIDTRELVRELQDNGIRVLGSSIIGLEEHTPENIEAAIDYAVSHDTEFHQFMLYTPLPGTRLFAEHQADGTLLGPEEYSHADSHGQHKFNYRHPHIKNGQETELLLSAFDRDFQVNGPGIVRVFRTILRGWQRHKNNPDPRIRKRSAWEVRDLAAMYSGALWAARRYYRRSNPAMSAKISRILEDVYREFGLKARVCAPIVGRYVAFATWREERRLRQGWTYEPPTFRESNKPVAAQKTS